MALSVTNAQVQADAVAYTKMTPLQKLSIDKKRSEEKTAAMAKQKESEILFEKAVAAEITRILVCTRLVRCS